MQRPEFLVRSCRHQSVLTQQSLLMPRKENGDVDWNTLGNILTAKLIGEVLCASYMDAKHRLVQSSFAVDTEWKFAYEEDGVVVLRKEFSDSPIHCWMGRGVIDLPLREIAAFIAAPESAVLFDKHIVESKRVEVFSQSDIQTDAISYYRTEAKGCLVSAKRDFLFYIRYAHTDGKYVQTAISVEHPQCPPVEGIRRGQMHPGCGWHLEPYIGNSQRTMVSYVVHIDLMGMPPVIANRVLKRQPLNIVYIKRHLMRRQQEQSNAVPPPFPNTVDDGQSGTHFEDPLPLDAFTKDQMSGQKTQTHSI